MNKDSLNRMIWSPLEYADAAVLANEVAEEMLSRLDWMTIKPKIIVDMGCGTGGLSIRLPERYPNAQVLALDFSEPMVQYAREQFILAGEVPVSCVCADAGRLPLEDLSVDLIVANLLLPWHGDVKSLLREWRRVLRPEGLLLFSALGPDTLKEFHNLLNINEIPFMVDMHDLGDLLLGEGFADPVLDVNQYTVLYRDPVRLLRELHASGMLLSKPGIDVNQGMIHDAEGQLPVTYEVVFAHAFMPEQTDAVSVSSDGIARVPLDHLRRQLKQR
jgi:malonyl-CoA O-methyltransferase